METESPTQKDIPMLAAALQDLNDSGLLTAKRLADLLDINLSSAYRHISGETETSWRQVRTLFRNCRHAGIQARLLGLLADHTGWIAEHITTELDCNGDGVVNTADIIDSTIQALRSAAEALEVTRSAEKCGMNRLDAPDAHILNIHLNLSLQKLLASRRVVAFLADRTQRAMAGGARTA